MSRVIKGKYKLKGSDTVWDWAHVDDNDGEGHKVWTETHHSFDGWVVEPNFGTPCKGTLHEADSFPCGF